MALRQANKKTTLAALVGVSCASILYVQVPKFEGNVLRGYLDPVGIPTKCTGDTHDVIVGKRYTTTECKASLETQLISHAEPILKCVPQLKGHTYQLAASISFGYNIGSTAFCNSETARKFRLNDFKGGCKAIQMSDNGKLVWVTARGQILQGLVNRRKEERVLCETDLK